MDKTALEMVAMVDMDRIAFLTRYAGVLQGKRFMPWESVEVEKMITTSIYSIRVNYGIHVK